MVWVFYDLFQGLSLDNEKVTCELNIVVMKNLCESLVPATSAPGLLLAQPKQKCHNGADRGIFACRHFGRFLLTLMLWLCCNSLLHAGLDTLVHTSEDPLLSFTDTQLSSTSRVIILGTVKTFDHPVKVVRYELNFDKTVNASKFSVSLNASFNDDIAHSLTWSASGKKVLVVLSFTNAYNLPAGDLVDVNINDASTPSMVANELLSLDGIVITENLDGLRLSHAGGGAAGAETGEAPGGTSHSVQGSAQGDEAPAPRLYPSVAQDIIRISGLHAQHRQVRIVATNGQVLTQALVGHTGDWEMDVSQLPAGCYTVQLQKADGSDCLRFLRP
jgi:hypothetical protein